MKNQKGTSLVSVIVSFAVLMIVLLLLQVSITASGRYAARAKDIWEEVVTAENRYVNGDCSIAPTDIIKVGLVMEFVGESGKTEQWGRMEMVQTRTDADQSQKLYYVKQE